MGYASKRVTHKRYHYGFHQAINHSVTHGFQEQHKT